MLPPTSSVSCNNGNKEKKTYVGNGNEIDKFIADTREFISKKSSPVSNQCTGGSEQEMSIPDDVINEFVEVLTRSGIDNPVLSSTKIEGHNISDPIFDDEEDKNFSSLR